MIGSKAAPKSFPWPPVIYLAAIVAASVLDRWVPLPWIGYPLSDMLVMTGWVFVAATAALYYAVHRTHSKAKKAAELHGGAEQFVTSGPFGFTRNPIFLADTLLVIGIGLISEIVWFLPLAIIAAFVVQKLAIEREEKHLALHFGKKYRDYAKRVRRWI